MDRFRRELLRTDIFVKYYKQLRGNNTTFFKVKGFYNESICKQIYGIFLNENNTKREGSSTNPSSQSQRFLM